MLDKHLIAKISPIAKTENVVRFLGYRITVLADRLFRIEQDKDKIFNDNATQTVWFRDTAPVAYSLKKSEKEVLIKTDRVTLCVNENFEKSYCLINGKKRGLTNKGNLMGTNRTLDNCIGDLEIFTKKKIELCYGVCAKTGIAVLDDVKSLILDGQGKLQNAYSQDKDLYVFAYGNDYKGAVKALYTICGEMPLIPKFALGNWWSRYYPYSEKSYLEMIDRLEEKDIPIIVATIDMDWHYANYLDEQKKIAESGKNTEYYGGNVGWTGYSWNTELFPDYKRFLQELIKRKYAITLNIHPADGVRWFEDAYEEFAIAMGVDPKSERHIPFDITDDNFINNYFKILHKPYEKDGVRFWWIDWQQGTTSKKEGLDPLWALNHYHFLDSAVDRSPLILSRFAGVGSHRYPLGFSGDTVIDWKTLKYLPYFTATASNVGYGWWSHDIGGHMLGIKDDELYLRFIQYGVFSPINRLHSTRGELRSKEPQFYPNGYGEIVENFLRLRHKMIPYIHSANYRSHLFGQALIEPIYYYEDSVKAYKYVNEYYFGGELLASPITKKSGKYGLTEMKVYLPNGKWTDFFTGDRYEGGKEYNVVRWLDSFPLFAKEGAIIPTYADYVGNSVENHSRLQVDVYNGDGAFDLYEDDIDGELFITKFKTEYAVGEEKIKISFLGNKQVVPKEREFVIRFKNVIGGDLKVVIGGKENSFKKTNDGCLTACFKISDYDKAVEVSASFREETKLERLKRLAKRSMNLFNGPNDVLQGIFEELEKAESVDGFVELVNNFTKHVNVLPDFLVDASAFYTKISHWKTLPLIYARRLLETV